MRVAPFEYSNEEIKQSLNVIRLPLSIALVAVGNPFNIGVIIRVAHSFLVKNIFLIGEESYYMKPTMGMHKYENIVVIPTEQEFIEKTNDYTRVAFERETATETLNKSKLPLDNPLFIFGSEQFGLSRYIIDNCQRRVVIEMNGINNSLPVSVAASIAINEWCRQYYEYVRS